VSNVRTLYISRGAPSPAERSALANVYRLILDRAQKKAATSPVSRPDAGVRKAGEVSHVDQ
jgi:hypothetical protein